MDQLIHKLANNWISKGIIKSEDKDIYIYGFREGLMILANIVTSLVIGVLMGMWWQVVLFTLVYSPIRSYAGGIHAKTHKMCYFMSIILVVVALSIIKYVQLTYLHIYIIAIISSVVIIAFSPVQDDNKPLDDKEMIVYKKKSIALLLFIDAMLFILIFTNHMQASITVCVALFTLSIMLVLGKIRNHKNAEGVLD